MGPNKHEKKIDEKGSPRMSTKRRQKIHIKPTKKIDKK